MSHQKLTNLEHCLLGKFAIIWKKFKPFKCKNEQTILF